MPKATVTDAAQIMQRSRETILEYEKRGLLTAERTIGGVRLFEVDQVQALKAMLDARRAPASSDQS
jgi:DNA-binding transcriptional MerR regulator